MLKILAVYVNAIGSAVVGYIRDVWILWMIHIVSKA